ncbi:putative receptor-type adenylate cyclase, partial [Trypanosoma theileri]
LRYADFTAAFSGSVSADRLVFATNLPHWADEKTESETVRKFHAAVTDENEWTPLSLRAFVSTRLVQTVLSRMDIVSADTLSDFFFKNIIITLDDMVYGSFADGSECVQHGIVDTAKCVVNYGATRISVWSMSRALDPTVPELFPPFQQHKTLLVTPFSKPLVRNVFTQLLALSRRRCWMSRM